MKIIDAATTRDALAFGPLLDALNAMFVQGCEVPLRHTHVIPDPATGAATTVLIMPAWQPGGFLGIKTVNIAPANAQRGVPGLHSTYLLYDATTGVPLAQMDGNEITSRRTAAASALGAAYLAREDASHLALLGAGRVGSLVPLAHRTVRPIERVSVWDRDAAAAARLVDGLREQGFEAQVCETARAAVAEADVVTCATLATEPVVQAEWLAPGVHLDLIGSFTPQMREADDACFAGATLFVDTEEALAKSGELLGPMSRGVFTAQDVRGTLADLCRGGRIRRNARDERTVFKAVGTALEDLAAAMLVWRATQDQQDH
ncbi:MULTISPECIES: ornithine cyclodeaminase family protein [Pandoraea]|uniref:ornithine cyclodeaminase family protein n=1 Tax=Pandoraea TaxID=93217 RepID=UPI001F5D2BB0|nr:MULTISPECIES: ornithine cyclodeaminase family protein [Pandoraea]MCI3208767.1 ornithine cyclodeaminase family protein [Pandoraea sp. LA3]MDN4586796.1 ornithine cyclodeaminase family protein [Pandoraea capi]